MTTNYSRQMTKESHRYYRKHQQIATEWQSLSKATTVATEQTGKEIDQVAQPPQPPHVVKRPSHSAPTRTCSRSAICSVAVNRQFLRARKGSVNAHFFGFRESA
eukprot:gene256-3632_t